MTVYVVPCGISLLDQLGKKLPAGGSAAARFTRAIGDGKWLNGVDLDDSAAVTRAWSDKAENGAREAGLEDAVAKRLSAETHTLATRLTNGRRLDSGQHVLLLASDTRMGLTAAFCVARYLTGCGSGLPGYTSSPRSAEDKWDLAVAENPVTVIRLRGLKPEAADFNLVALGIGKALRAAADLGGPVEVHLTGGYKATLLHTLAMTEVLYSMAPDRVSAWNVFEDVLASDSGQPVSPTRIGLRGHQPGQLEMWRCELESVRKGSFTCTKDLEGVGWIKDGKDKRRLTDFGWGYLAVLGEPGSSRGVDNS